MSGTLSAVGRALQSGASRFFPAPKFLNVLAGAIDVSESSVKYLTIAKQGSLYVPDVCLQIPLPEGVVKAGVIQKPDQLGQVLKGLVVKQGGGEVYASLPEEFAYIYPISINAQQSAEQRRAAVEFSLSEHVPLPEQQIVYDSLVIPHAEVKTKYISVTAFDAKKSEEYVELMTRAGFTVRAIEPEVHAAVRACVKSEEQGTVLLFDVGRTRTGITAVLNGVPISTSTIEEGGRCITDALLPAVGLDPEKAEQLKRVEGFHAVDTHPEIAQMLAQATEKWAVQLKEYVTFLTDSHASSEIPLPPISKIVLCGGEVSTPGFVDWIRDQLRLNVEVANVWSKLFTHDEFIPSIPKSESLRFATAVGLLLRNLEE